MLFETDTLPVGDYKRIVSLVPSLSETLAGLGVGDRLVGRTRFCASSPEKIGHAKRIGGTKDPDIQKIRALKPDLILTVKEENRAEDAKTLAVDYPTAVFDIRTVAHARLAIQVLGQGLNISCAVYHPYLEGIDQNIHLPQPPGSALTCLYLIWKDPYMTIGRDTYIADIMRQAGMRLPDENWTRYPTVNIEAVLKHHRIDAILLSTEPYPFKQRHADALSEQFGIPVLLVDGQLFSWYGTLTPAGLRYARQIRESLVGAHGTAP